MMCNMLNPLAGLVIRADMYLIVVSFLKYKFIFISTLRVKVAWRATT